MTTTVFIVDVLSALLEAEQAGLFHFMADADPHISRASAALRKPLGTMIAASKRHEAELTSLISDLGGTPRPVPVNPEHQYIAFLTTDFLLPKLADAKRESMKRYEQALRQIEGADPAVESLLAAHLADHRRDLSTLGRFVSSPTGRASG